MTPEEFQMHVVDTLARLDTKMTDLAGNGKPGRVNKLEESVEELKRVRWTTYGMLVGASTVASTIIRYVFK